MSRRLASTLDSCHVEQWLSKGIVTALLLARYAVAMPFLLLAQWHILCKN